MGNTLRYDIVTIKYNSSGDTLRVKRYESGVASNLTGIITDTAGYVYITGSQTSSYATIKYNPGFVSVGSPNKIPAVFELYQNYPNPFNPNTAIKYNMPVTGFVKIFIYGLSGKEVSVLVNGQKSPGSYETVWDASNFSSGVYFYRITAEYDGGSYAETKKMVLIK